MQSKAEESLRSKMESLRLICDKDISTQLQKFDTFTTSFTDSLDSIRARAEETVENQGKLVKLKTSLREAENEFVKVLAVKTGKEAKQMATRDSISAVKTRIEELKRTLQVQGAKRDEYAAVMSQLSLEKGRQDSEHKGEIQEAMLWYNRVLGFQIEGGHGVKFTFNNINMKDPHEEYSFTIRHENDAYTLLACDPHLDDTKELIHELNKTNGLFNFVRTMRGKFQEAASQGLLPQPMIVPQESSTISVSAPMISVSTDRSESPMKRTEHPNEEVIGSSKKVNRGKGAKHRLLSPQPVRQSPRFKGKK